ncbi:MAG: hypothetical protein U9P70_00285 [Patescibacteria group bacterium]|nr:hypothetical protein [Patescibacteria group bacterium]
MENFCVKGGFVRVSFSTRLKDIVGSVGSIVPIGLWSLLLVTTKPIYRWFNVSDLNLVFLLV